MGSSLGMRSKFGRKKESNRGGLKLLGKRPKKKDFGWGIMLH
jgi:hypothetical protein